MMGKIEFLSLITLLNLIQFGFSWPTGAPEKVCDNLMPKHGNNQAKSPDSSVFVITQSSSTYQSGDRVQVVIQSPNNDYSFRGLIVQAYDPISLQPIGSFSAGRGLKNLECSAVTHADRKGKRSATLIWESPEGVQQPSEVAFRATIVQRFSDFYTGLNAIPESKA